MAVVVSLINMKGGVGKTTITAQLAISSVRKGIKTLVIDLDPQANLSQVILGQSLYASHLNAKKPTIVNLFEQFVPPRGDHGGAQVPDIREAILKWSPDLIPSRLELARVLKKPGLDSRRLAASLAPIYHEYELILIDCAPTESLLTDAAYHASRFLLVPVKPEFLATIGMPLLAQSMTDFRSENRDHDLDVCGIVFNYSSANAAKSPEGLKAIAEVEEEATIQNWPVFTTRIRYSRAYPNSARAGTSLASTKYTRSSVMREFDHFVDEFLAVIQLRKEAS